MKALSIYVTIVFSLFTTNLFAQTSVKKDTIKVWGNCGMCQATIEKAAKKAGAKTANWNEDTKQLNVTYLPTKSSSQKIQQAIAKVGYDTQDFTGDDKAYSKLHSCCQYERKGLKN
jgi:periplasmic mercuric ion binding protein